MEELENELDKATQRVDEFVATQWPSWFDAFASHIFNAISSSDDDGDDDEEPKKVPNTTLREQEIGNIDKKLQPTLRAFFGESSKDNQISHAASRLRRHRAAHTTQGSSIARFRSGYSYLDQIEEQLVDEWFERVFGYPMTEVGT